MTKIHEPSRAQPLCTALQMAMVDLLADWSIRPSAVVGHSSGEIAAAYCAGHISFESALKISFFRGALASDLQASGIFDGAMSSISMSEKDIEPILDQVNCEFGSGRVSVGCVNSPSNVTV